MTCINYGKLNNADRVVFNCKYDIQSICYITTNMPFHAEISNDNAERIASLCWHSTYSCDIAPRTGLIKSHRDKYIRGFHYWCQYDCLDDCG